jgi:alkanesulfonate monooxygenase SsuD/methylene tetrahydromethanopterin reductase-like flavin-dependent oxidoreductase (luciferase family)
MKFGFMIQLQMPKPWSETTEREAHWNAVEQAVKAEEAGFDRIWITEQHFYVEIGHSAAPDMMLAAISQRTKRIRLGFGVVVLPCHHPFHVAERVATLDILSDGRAEFGFGRGTAEYITEGFGVSGEDVRAYADESVTAVMSMFEHEHFPGFKGQFFDLPSRQVVPRVIQKPHPPLWTAASNLESWARAAKRGLGVIGVTRLPPEEAKDAVDAYWGEIKASGPDDWDGQYANPSAGAFAITCCHDDDAIGRGIATAAARWYYGQNDAELNRLRFGSAAGIKGVLATVKDRTDEELIDDAMVVGGDADTCSRVVERWAKIGLDQMVFMMQAGTTTQEQVMRSIELIGEKVIPRFQ